MIILENVSKTFHDKTVLQKTDLTVESGTITGFIGRNGSGKTVLLKLICGLMLPTTGTVTVDGVQVGRDRDFAPEAGVLIETPSFINYESGLRNLRALAAIRRKISVEQVKDAICLVGLDPEDKKRVGMYSLGMRQRLGIAQAIMEDPSLIILDEPMNGLDKEGVEEMRVLFSNLRGEGKTILLASHSAEDVDLLCDAVYELDNGAMERVR